MPPSARQCRQTVCLLSLLLLFLIRADGAPQPGALDLRFHAGTSIGGPFNAIAIQPDGKILIGGGFTAVQQSVRNRVARLLSDGRVDPDYGLGSLVQQAPPGSQPSTVRTLLVETNGRTIIAGA